jgi:hypothetical protein
MNGIVWLIPIGIVLIGALLQTLKLTPRLLDKYFDMTATKLTIIASLLFASVIILLFFLKLRNRWNREGFQTNTVMENWKQMVDRFQIRELCELKGRLEQTAIALYKGTPPNEKSDAEAKKLAETVFSENTMHGSINCELFKKTMEANDIDSFFVAIQLLPPTFFIQAYETAERCRNLLMKQVVELEKNLNKQKEMKEEGFVDPSVGVCSAEIVEERRKFLRQKKLDEQAQRCLLPEEVPLESKEKVAQNTLSTMNSTFENYIKMQKQKNTIQGLIKQALGFEATLNKAEEDAKSGKLFE